jgi:hypothetical protein
MAFRHWYAGDCDAAIARFLSDYTLPPDFRLPGLATLSAACAPHAGWRYSGRVAARAVRTLAETKPEVLLLFSAVHRAAIEGPALWADGAWETPLGDVEVDVELARELQAAGRDFPAANFAAHADEHALEVILPFVKALLPAARIVPIMVPPASKAAVLGELCARTAAGRRAAALASTDLTHYGASYSFTPAGHGEEAHEWMRRNDQRLIALALGLKAEDIVPRAIEDRSACGPGALAAAVAFARARGSQGGVLIDHTDSHEVEGRTGDFEMAVGYAGMVF